MASMTGSSARIESLARTPDSRERCLVTGVRALGMTRDNHDQPGYHHGTGAIGLGAGMFDRRDAAPVANS